jgi:hypothetical protein
VLFEKFYRKNKAFFWKLFIAPAPPPFTLPAPPNSADVGVFPLSKILQGQCSISLQSVKKKKKEKILQSFHFQKSSKVNFLVFLYCKSHRRLIFQNFQLCILFCIVNVTIDSLFRISNLVFFFKTKLVYCDSHHTLTFQNFHLLDPRVVPFPRESF